MKTQHTKGPWSWVEIYGIKNLFSESGELILGCDDSQDQSFIGPNDNNARLIAAAPDLLQALEWAFDRLSNLNIPEQGGSCDGFGWDTEGNKLKIENIIKKARGES